MRIALIAALIAVSATAEPRSAVDPLIRRLMREGEVPGLSIVVIQRGRIAWQQAYEVTDRTVFEAASLGKPVFAYAVMKLADRGVLSLDVPLHHYMPEPVPDERMKTITARMVLTHRTGFQNEVMPGQTLALGFTPGERFSYSGAGFLYLERVIEHLTGKELTTLMRDLVFQPLGMHDSGYTWLPEYDTRKASGHRSSGRKMERRRPAAATMATLHTTPADYARFVIATMKHSPAMLASQTAVATDITWGLGWGLERTPRGTAFWHHGENWGEFQNFVLGYQDGDGVVIFTNSGNGFSIMPEIVTAVLGGNHPAFDWMGYERYHSPAKVLLRDIRVRGARAALSEPVVDTLTEAQINRLGYALLDIKRIPDAIAVFERNVARFPDSANVYDSLAEAYAAAGDREKADAFYEKSRVTMTRKP